jgi:hypothetical protein
MIGCLQKSGPKKAVLDQKRQTKGFEMSKKQKLELTWIRKEYSSVLDPRILVKYPEKGHGNSHSERVTDV